jgi:putative hydrolase of the HAD superfamily
MISTIVFDFGNVIGFFDYRITTERLARHCDLSPDVIQQRIYGGELEDDYESGRMSSVEFLRSVRELCTLRCTDQELQSAYEDMFSPNASVCALIPSLKPHYKLLLGSNTTELHSAHFRKQFAETFHHFDGLVLSHEVGARKPRPEFFLHAQRLAGSKPEECLFIDDLPVNVEGARALGWKGIVYRAGDDLRRGLQEHGIQVKPGIEQRIAASAESIPRG